jgi:hypothetical protein
MAQTPAPVATAFVDTPQPIVKVMRLYKPTIHVCTPVPELTFLSHAPSVSQEFAFSEMLLLPESFGDIYMGETFCAYVSMVNSSDAALRNVNLNTRLQTSNSNFDLPDVRSPQPTTVVCAQSRLCLHPYAHTPACLHTCLQDKRA